MTKFTPSPVETISKGQNTRSPRAGKYYIPPVHIDDIPQFSFKELL